MEVHDLTLTVSHNTPTFPGSPAPNFISWEKQNTDQYNSELLFFSSHTGTHVDAPYHFVKDGKKIHELNPSRFFQNATLIRVKSRYISKHHIIQFERVHGDIPTGATIVFATGWNDVLNRKDFFVNNPGLSGSAARYLVSRKVNLVGIDSPSIDVGTDSKFTAHHILLKRNVVILENLCNLSKIKTIHFNLAAIPLKLQNATGSPVRAIAF